MSVTGLVADNVEAYIPGDRRRALAGGVEIPDRVIGAALFADISGFTPLTEALARELGGRRGAEELTRALDQVLDAVLEKLHQHGGSVIYFSGDAVTCWFDGDDGQIAVECGLAMQEAVTRVGTITTPGGTTVELGMKVAVAAGPARRFVVGDPDIQLIDVLAGSLLDRLADLEHHSERGEVLVDLATLEGLGGRVEFAFMPGDKGDSRARPVGVVAALSGEGRKLKPPRPAPRLPRAVVRQWILPSVYERMVAGRGEFLAELRPVIPMFLRFGGFDFDRDDDAPGRLDHFIRRAQRIVDGFGGNVLQLTIGDKGAYLYAVFGSPLAHEDDAAHACSAALNLLSLEGGTDATEMQIGLARGQLRSGTYGHRHRRTFACLGDATNLAARLMSAAPVGQVYVTAELAERAGARFTFEALPDFKAKGKSDVIPVRRLNGASRRAPARDPRPLHRLVGRASELALLEGHAREALTGTGKLVALSAEAGMGKTRLAEELLSRLRLRGHAVHSGAASTGEAVSYQAWQGVFTSLFGITSDDDPTADLERSLRQTDAGLLPRLPLLGTLFGVPLEDNALTASFDAKLRKTSLESLLIIYLTTKAAEQPMVVFLEDCHWLDPLSIDLLELVARAIASLPVLVVLTTRPGSFTAPRLRNAATLELDSLDEAEGRELLTARLGELYGPDTSISDALLHRLLERAEGNPFYMEELVKYLHSQGADPADQTAASVDLPATLSSLVLSRIDRVGESSRRTLKVASVVGRDFSIQVLTGAYPDLGAYRQVRRHLRRLTAADLVVPENDDTEEYTFKHAVIREVAYESIPFALCTLLHGRIGLWIEATTPDALDVLAHHFWLSSEEDKKREYLHRAGEAAEKRYANDAAVDYFRRLAPLLPDAERGAVLLKLGAVLELRGDLGDSETVYTQAVDLALRLGDDTAEAWALTSRAEPMRKQGRYDEVEAELDLAWTIFKRTGNTAGLGRVAHVRGLVANLQGDPERSRTQFEESLQACRARGDRRTEATLLGNLAMPAAHQGEYERAQELSEQALAIRSELSDRWGIGVSLNNIAMLAYLRQDYAEAQIHLREALRAGLEVGDLYGIAISQHNLGNASRELGDSTAAGDHYSEALHIYALTGDRWSLCMLFDDIAMLSSSLSPADAIRLAGASEALRELIGSPRLDYQEEELDKKMAGARRRRGDAAADDVAAGRRLDADAAVQLATGLCRIG